MHKLNDLVYIRDKLLIYLSYDKYIHIDYTCTFNKTNICRLSLS